MGVQYMTTVPKLWPGSTIVCIGTGPSLTQADVDFCRDKARVIVVNDAYKLAPWADVLYACDQKWWTWHKGVPEFAGLKYRLQGHPNLFPNVQVLKNMGRIGLCLDPHGVMAGYNSGFQAVGVAVHLGAARIVLLGYDMGQQPKGPSHFFGEHRDKTRPPYAACIQAFRSLPAPLQAAGIDIVNCSRQTALGWFRKEPLEAVLVEQAA